MKRLSFRKVCLCIAAVFLFSAVSLAAPPKYTLTPLGPRYPLNAASFSNAYDINNAGQVVGTSSIPLTGDSQGCLWQDGVMTNLNLSTRAYAINDVGQVLGVSRSVGYCLWQNGVLTELHNPCEPKDINNAGQMVGLKDGAAFLLQGGIMTNLGTFGGIGSNAYAINDIGQVVGEFSTVQNGSRAFLWQDGVMTNLGSLGNSGSSTAYDINNAGQVVGLSSGAEDGVRAFLWQNGVMANLGSLGSENSIAYGINDAGQVVGQVYEDLGSISRAFLWQDGTMYDLNACLDGSGFGIILKEARAINNLGQIVGNGWNPSGYEEAFLLTPVPEPASAAIMILGTVWMAAKRK